MAIKKHWTNPFGGSETSEACLNMSHLLEKPDLNDDSLACLWWTAHKNKMTFNTLIKIMLPNAVCFLFIVLRNATLHLCIYTTNKPMTHWLGRVSPVAENSWESGAKGFVLSVWTERNERGGCWVVLTLYLVDRAENDKKTPSIYRPLPVVRPLTEQIQNEGHSRTREIT